MDFVEVLGSDRSERREDYDASVVDDDVNLELSRSRLPVLECVFGGVDQSGAASFGGDVCADGNAADGVFRCSSAASAAASGSEAEVLVEDDRAALCSPGCGQSLLRGLFSPRQLT